MSVTDLQGNIWKYTLLLITNKRIFVAVLGAYYLTIQDVNAAGIGIILLAGSLAGFVFEIPSGYVSDKIGHKSALIISRLFILLSTVLFLFANDIVLLILASIAMSTGHAFQSGTGSAFMHETLRGLNREKDYPSVMGRVSSIGFAVPIVLMVFVPFLVSVSFKLPFVIALFIDFIGLAAAIALIRPSVAPEAVKEIGVTNFFSVIKEGYRLNFFDFALFSGILLGALFAVGGFRAPYQTFLEIPVIWYGVFFGIGRGLASLLLALSGGIKAKLTILSFFRLELVLFVFLIFLLGTVHEPWIIVAGFILINAFHWGLSTVNSSYLLDLIRDSKFKATLLSTRAQISNLVGALLGGLMGFAIEKYSYTSGFLLTGVLLVVTLVPLYLHIIRKHKAGIFT